MRNKLVAACLFFASTVTGMDLTSIDKCIQDLVKINNMMSESHTCVIMDTASKLNISLKESDIVGIDCEQLPVYGAVLTAILGNGDTIVTAISGYGISRYACSNQMRVNQAGNLLVNLNKI